MRVLCHQWCRTCSVLPDLPATVSIIIFCMTLYQEIGLCSTRQIVNSSFYIWVSFVLSSALPHSKDQGPSTKYRLLYYVISSLCLLSPVNLF